ncbi:MAG: FAD-dependent oxidoreductase [Hyphomonas sp.]|nr:FAD-dependent oxidoreductase [Hyphomonas sp.]
MTGLSGTRRDLITGLAAAAALAGIAPIATAQTSVRLIVVGGGFGGATAARFLKQFLPSSAVTLIEPNTDYYACPFSNLVIGGLRDLSAQRFGYDGLRGLGIDVVQDRAEDIDPVAHSVTLGSGDVLAYDRLVLSPGIDIRWNAIEGYDAAAASIMPHAWKAGAQTELLRNQLSAMEDGGLVVMAVPPAPFRCPPGPYERASLIANYLKAHKPKSRLLILDAQDKFSKQPLFEEAWSAFYPGLIERRGAEDFSRVVAVDPARMVLSTEFEEVTAAVANVIPPQMAGEIAQRAGVANATGWCPIDAVTFGSALQPDIHVIGDATIAAPMPKSAFSANLQAKLCAAQVARLVSGLPPEPTLLTNTCYSYLSADAAVSITGIYSNEGGKLTSIAGAGGLSPNGMDPVIQGNEAMQAATWFRTITQQAFG